MTAKITAKAGKITAKAAKISKDSVNYRWASPLTIAQRCGTCTMFAARNNTCTLVAGRINSLSICDKYQARRG